MDWRDHIIVDPQILVGKPVVRGTRISVELVIDLLAAGWTEQQVLASYPTLKAGNLRACLAYASAQRKGLSFGTRMNFLADENFPRPGRNEPVT